MAHLYLLMVVWAVEAFVFRLLLLLVLCKQLLCAFLSLIFLCGMMPFFVVGVLRMLEMQVSQYLELRTHKSNGNVFSDPYFYEYVYFLLTYVEWLICR
jgi:hypothetical protein